MTPKNSCKNIKIIQDQSGFTLVEVMIAIGIFAIGFLAVGLMQINAMTTTNSARRTTEAMTLAENRAEWLRTLPFYDSAEDLDLAGGVEDYDIHPDLQEADIGSPHEDNVDGPFFVRWTVIDDRPLPANTMREDAAGNEVTRSKTIRVWVTRDNDNINDIQAEIEFAKFAGQFD